MNKKRKKGFTLIELLAVIVILAIIALIATPIIVGVINKSKKNAFMDTAYGVIEAGKLYYAKNFNNDDFTGKTFTFPAASDDLKLSGEKIGGGSLEVNGKGGQTLAIYDKGKNWCASKKETDSKISIDKYEEGKCGSTSGGEEDHNGIANAPTLDNGLIPVTIENNGTVKKADTNSKWYDYENKQWANAVLVSNDVRSTYKNGDVITEDKILAYFVWIPRYEYKLFESDTPIEIQMNFIAKSTTKASDGYIVHPAFTFGTEQLSGIWFGKFEMTGTATKPTIKPNTTNLNNQNIKTQFSTALIFGNRVLNTDGTITSNIDKSVYGLTSESRMMKNTDWGAVVYLTNSKYGINSKIRINNNTGSKTGCGANVEDGPSTTACQLVYGASATYPQSTTGNITGIFDISGGATEKVMAVVETSLNSGVPINASSGFTSTVKFPEQKYYNLYAYGTTENDAAAYNRSILGDAIKETKGWYKGLAYFSSSSAPWVLRSNSNNAATYSGTFNFNRNAGHADGNQSFRTVIS